MYSLNPAFINSDENDNSIQKKKISHNRTQKRYEKDPSFTDRVSKVLEKIHNMDDDDDSNLGDFSPPPPPTSVGAERAALVRESMKNLGSSSTTQIPEYSSSLGNTQPLPNDVNNEYELNNFKSNYGDKKTNEEYYKKYIANYKNNEVKMQNSPTNIGSDVLINKLNYMIHLLEEKQDERTNNVTEEVVLYSFLGIFIIFIVDSFSRVGKYVR